MPNPEQSHVALGLQSTPPEQARSSGESNDSNPAAGAVHSAGNTTQRTKDTLESDTTTVPTSAEPPTMLDPLAERRESHLTAGNSTPVSGQTHSKKQGERPKLPRPEGKLPCPRCQSENTKFCYYNNYNVNQPRYYCKVQF